MWCATVLECEHAVDIVLRNGSEVTEPVVSGAGRYLLVWQELPDSVVLCLWVQPDCCGIGESERARGSDNLAVGVATDSVTVFRNNRAVKGACHVSTA